MTDATDENAPRLRLLTFPNQEDALPNYIDAGETVQRGIVRLLNVVTHLQPDLPILLILASLISVRGLIHRRN
jgi:hypothetical protein